MILWLPVSLILSVFSAGLLMASSEIHMTPFADLVEDGDDSPVWVGNMVKGVARVFLCLLASLGFTLSYLAAQAAFGF